MKGIRMENSIKLYTKRFLLRELKTSDATPNYLGWFKDSEVKKYIISASKMMSLEDLRIFISEEKKKSNALFLGIFEKNTDRHIGNIKYDPINITDRYAIMGILIGDPDFRGKGVTHEVIKASAIWLKQNFDVKDILLGVDASNIAAVRAYEKTGFIVSETPHIPKKSLGENTMVWNISEG